MTIRTLLARLRTTHSTHRRADTATDYTSRHTDQLDRRDQRDAWQPTARSAYGRHVQASQHRQAAIEAITEHGRQHGIDAKDVLAALDRLDTELRARGWHPDQFDYDDDDPGDDHVNRVDVDYDPRMAAYDARTSVRGDEDGDSA